MNDTTQYTARWLTRRCIEGPTRGPHLANILVGAIRNMRLSHLIAADFGAINSV
jgi:hypothetical protein